MANYVLSCCSTADLTPEHFASRDIHYICFHYQLNGADYLDDLGQSVPFDQFYQAMVDGATTRTQQVNADEYQAYFASFLDQGLDVLHLTLSSGISGTYNSACIARENLERLYPGRRIVIIDSLGASSGYGLIMDKLADLRDQGLSLDEAAAWAEQHKLELHHWFFSTDLTFYIKGGRISRSAGLVGKLLNICPLLNMSSDGRLIPREKIRTKRKVIAAIVDRMAQHAQGGLAYADKCYVCHSACYADAKAVAGLVEARFPHLNGHVEINDVGTTIGSHTGPGTVALFFWGDQRKD